MLPLPSTIVVTLPEMAFLKDHAIAGKAIVPAVELIDILLHVLDRQGVKIAVPLVMRDVTFPRFLAADDLPRCVFEVTLAEASGGVRTAFASKIALPGGISRTRVHAQATFGGVADFADPPAEARPAFEVPADRLYRELVRFGPHFCNLVGSVRLASNGAWASVGSPSPPHPNPSKAGCPYLLDSAMHLACAWGQRYAGIVAYPTGFSSRTVVSPIAAGRRRCVAVARTVEARRLVFDLWLTDAQDRVCDAVTGLVMAPLASGAPPPAWIVEGKS
jgi:hypothetical protein